MPLRRDKSDASFKSNVRTLIGEVGKSPHVKSRDQALAISYAIKRRGKKSGGRIAGFAAGGAPDFKISPSYMARAQARSLGHVGPINSMVPGRTDRHNVGVKPGSFIVPSDVVSHLGQNNTQAGMAVLSRMFSSAPYGGTTMKIKPGVGAPRLRADGGEADGNDGSLVPIVVAGGEYSIPPETVLQIGEGDLKYGHRVLDRWVLDTRAKHIKTLRGLPPPAKD